MDVAWRSASAVRCGSNETAETDEAEDVTPEERMRTNPTAAGLSPARLEKIDRFVQSRYIDAGKLPGALTVILRRGEVAHCSPLGFADVERKQPVREDTIFRIYSMTKPITSVAFMMLVEEGVVALDEPVHARVPEWKDLGVFQGGFMETFRTQRPDRPMLIIDLLRHTSGLTYGFQQSTNVDAAYRKLQIGEIEKHGTLDDLIRKLAGLPLEFSPGTAWNYSVSTDVLGYLVGKLSGEPFEHFLRSRIFKPLGMVDTDFHVPPEKHSRLAACYAAVPNRGMVLYDDPVRSGYLQPPSLISGGGGLVSTAADYLRFCRMLLNGGTLDGTQLLSPKTVELMTVNHLPDGKDLPALSRSLFSEATYNGIGFGLGFSVTLDRARTMLAGSRGDYSWGGAASTYFWIDPQEDLIAIFLTQLMPSSTYPIRRELRTLVYSAFTEVNR
jgi:CubicO group peptidase (beta-lactamase class C family)